MLLFRLLRDAFRMRDTFKRYAFLCDAFPSARCLFACVAYLILPISEFLPYTVALFFTGFDTVYVMFDLSLFTQFSVFNFVVFIYLKDLILS